MAWGQQLEALGGDLDMRDGHPASMSADRRSRVKVSMPHPAGQTDGQDFVIREFRSREDRYHRHHCAGRISWKLLADLPISPIPDRRHNP